MEETHQEPITVVTVSPDGDAPADDGELRDAAPSIDVVRLDSRERALDRLATDDVHCVVCEHDPPALDAVEFTRTVRDLNRDVPVLVVPADDATNVANALDAGATGVIERPARAVSPAVFANRIRTVVDGAGPTVPPAGEQSRPLVDEGDGKQASTAVDDRRALRDACARFGTLERRGEVAEALVSTVGEVIGTDGVGVFLFDDVDNHLRPVAMTETLEGYYGGNTVFGPRGRDSITWRAFVAGETLAFDDVSASPMAVYEDTDCGAGVFVPLGDHGTLVVASPTVGAFDDGTRSVAELLATTATAALDRIESEDRVRERDRQIRTIEERADYLARVNELYRDASTAVVGQSTREELEDALVERLVETDPFEFAWIGTVDGKHGLVEPRTWAGSGSQYLDDVRFDPASCDEPVCLTVRDGSPVAVDSVADDLAAGRWQREALGRGFHSMMAVPLATADVRYGVLAVYASRPNAFREPMADALEHIGLTTAWAVNATQRTYCVLSNETTELELRIEDRDDVLSVISRATGSDVDCVEVEPIGGGTARITFAANDVDAESVLASVADMVAVEDLRHVASDETHLFTAVVRGETVADALVKAGGVPVDVAADGTSLVVTVHVPAAVDPGTFVRRLERRYPDTELLARRRRDGAAHSRLGFLDEVEASLTARQMEVLRTAHDLGFFASPRRATGKEVANELGVSQPTVSHHLREAQGTVFDLLFGDE